MFELLTKAIIVLLLLSLVAYIVIRVIPRTLLTWLGSLVIIAFLTLAFLDTDSQFIEKLVRLVLLPLTPLGFAILLLSFLLWRGAGRLIWLPLALLWALSTPLLANQLAGIVEQRALALANETANAAAPVIVVLGGETTRPNLRPSPPSFSQVQLSSTGEIPYYAAQLYRWQMSDPNLPNPTMIVSAGSRLKLEDDDETKTHLEANDIQQVLGNMGVAQSQIILESEGDTIRESAEKVEKILEERSLPKNISLVSSSLTIDRAVRTFDKEIGEVNILARPTDFYTFQLEKKGKDEEDKKGRRLRSALEDRIPELFPSAEALSVNTRIIQELLLTVYYFLRGWIAPF